MKIREEKGNRLSVTKPVTSRVTSKVTVNPTLYAVCKRFDLEIKMG